MMMQRSTFSTFQQHPDGIGLQEMATANAVTDQTDRHCSDCMPYLSVTGKCLSAEQI
jgi:hypothetical protein